MSIFCQASPDQMRSVMSPRSSRHFLARVSSEGDLYFACTRLYAYYTVCLHCQKHRQPIVIQIRQPIQPQLQFFMRDSMALVSYCLNVCSLSTVIYSLQRIIIVPVPLTKSLQTSQRMLQQLSRDITPFSIACHLPRITLQDDRFVSCLLFDAKEYT